MVDSVFFMGAGLTKQGNLCDIGRTVAMRRSKSPPIFDFDSGPQVVLVASSSRILAWLWDRFSSDRQRNNKLITANEYIWREYDAMCIGPKCPPVPNAVPRVSPCFVKRGGSSCRATLA